MRRVRGLVWGLLVLGGVWLPSLGFAGTIETAFLEQPWPRQHVRETEVYKYAVRWRQRVSRTEGLSAGVQFTAPTDRGTTWALATDFTEVGNLTPGVKAVRYLEQTPTRQVIQLDVQVLWITTQMTFEVEQDPPNAVRFRMVHDLVGEYRGVLLLKDPAGAFRSSSPANTALEMATWLKPNRPVALGLLATVQRMILLRGVRDFLRTCEEAYRQPAVG